MTTFIINITLAMPFGMFIITIINQLNNMTTNKILLLLLLPVLSIFSCSQTEKQDETLVFSLKGDTVVVHDESLLESRITLTEAQSKPYSREVVTAGKVQPIPTQFAYIAPPFSGRITRSHVKLGQEVKANTPLFEIHSPEFTAAQKEFYQAQSSRELAQKDLQRKLDLIRRGVASQKELEEATGAMQIAEKEYETARAALQVYQVNPDEMVLGQALVVRSPIAGRIISNDIVTGQYLAGDSEPVATVANLSQVWVTAQVKEKDIRFIRVGEEMDIHIAALPGTLVKGKVFHIEEAVDEESRSIRVLSVCDNREGLLKIGLYTTVHFVEQEQPYVMIPEKALLQGEKESFVYVQVSPRTYVRTPVEVETAREGMVVVASGLQAGTKIIGEGGYYLK